MSADNSALMLSSPRLMSRGIKRSGAIVHTLIFSAWIVVLLGAWRFNGVLAWSAGLLYVVYDTSLILYVVTQWRGWLSTLAMQRSLADERTASNRTSVGVLIAARNEAAALPATIDALLAQTDVPDAILVIDDGSTDESLRVLGNRYGLSPSATRETSRSLLHQNLWLLSLPHGGKARALNAGLHALTTDVVMTVDADTLLQPDAIAATRKAFAYDKAMVAAGGVLVPLCRGSVSAGFFQWFQHYEYIRSFIARAAWMRTNALLLVSGALACFRRSALLQVGGFDSDCLVEDYEMIHRLHRWAHDHQLHWTVRILGNVRGVTDAPATLQAFLRQRRRWFAGFLQTQYWYRDMIGNARYGAVGRVMLPVKVVDTLQPIYGITAFVLLLSFLVRGKLAIAYPVFVIIGIKLVIDLGFHLWSVKTYFKWTNTEASSRELGAALLAALTEPFGFQLIRHAGAALGWISIISGRMSWSAPERNIQVPET